MLGITCAMFTGCGSSGSLEGDIEYIPVRLESDGKWAMVDGKGKLLFGEDFKNEPSMVVNGLFSVLEGEDYSLYKAGAKPQAILEGLTSVGVFNDGVIPVTPKKSRINLVDGSGKVKATLNPINGKEIVRCGATVHEGMLIVIDEEGKYGYVNKSGKTVIDPKFEAASNFYEGFAIVVKSTEDSNVGIVIDKNGKEVFRIKKDLNLMSIEDNEPHYKCGLLAARTDDGRCGFLNKKGEFTKVNGKVVRIGDYNSKYFTFMDSDYNWGVMDMDGEQIIRPKYGEIHLLNDGNFLIKDDKEYAILDKKGDTKLEFSDDYASVFPINNGHFEFIARDRSKYLLLDKDGKQIGKEDYSSIGWSTSAYGNNVTTDYFNADAVVQALVGGLTNGGFDKYKIGMPASELKISDYSNYVYSYKYADEDLNKSGWRYSVDFSVNTNSHIANREYDSFYNSNAVVNPDAKVTGICVSVHASVPCWSDIKDTVISDIQTKGYKLKDSGSDWVEFTGNDCILRINTSYNGTEISLNIISSQSLSDEEMAIRGEAYYEEVEEPMEVVEVE